MTEPTRLAKSLERVYSRTVQAGSVVLHTSQLDRRDRELLAAGGWLREIIKGWYILSRPDVPEGDSSAWYAHLWDFLRAYLHHHYGQEYCLSAEASLELHTGKTTIPKQVVVMVQKGGGNLQPLPYETSLYVYADPDNLPDERVIHHGLQVMPLGLALCRVAPTYFQRQPQEAELALKAIQTPSEITKELLTYRYQRAAGRLIGAYRFLGMDQFAQTIEEEMKRHKIAIVPENPFETSSPRLSKPYPRSAYGARIEYLWEATREQVIAAFPEPQAIPENAEVMLHQIEKRYGEDAYHSLSIEGYHVTEELVERVRNHQWNPELHPEDAQTRSTLAARGYYEAFQEVERSIEAIISGGSAGSVIAQDLQRWYQALWAPSVRAGLIANRDLAGYRTHPVYPPMP